MADRVHLDWFRERLAVSRSFEAKDPIPILAWRETLRGSIRFNSGLVGLGQLRDWSRDEHGNIRHKGGQFFSIEGARVKGGDLREVASWDQPIMTQPGGEFLGMLARETPGKGIEFLLQAIAECGNIDVLQIGPSIQNTWPNAGRARVGRRPPMAEVFAAQAGVRIVYQANQTEEGSRFWKRSNRNIVAFIDDERVIETDLEMYYWASLSQIKELALMDNVLSPFVKALLLPL
jgi:dTDP-4-dehydro-6-deoxy-alpha-D-glucopyranose 2,3-dehydratase